MDPFQLFTLANLSVVPAWLLLAILPKWKWTRIIAAYALPAGLAVVYFLIMLQEFDLDGGGFGSLQEVGRLFQNPWMLLAGWIHYLAFDLFVGAWEVRDASRLNVPHAYVIPCLLLTFLAGPVGLLLYFIVRISVVRRLPGRD
ncbi:MAG: ABA4-like family protein [Acidobacteriota bacterium]|nr:ABA4-like family protein [Acidobacteriota bacterium]